MNCGAAEPRTIHLSSSSGSGNGPSGSSAAGPSSGCAGPGGASSSGSGAAAPVSPAQFFRLRAGSEGAVRRGGWGWRNCRVAWEEAVRKENRVERLVARSDPAAAERRLMQRLLVARLEAVTFKGCSGGLWRAEQPLAVAAQAGVAWVVHHAGVCTGSDLQPCNKQLHVSVGPTWCIEPLSALCEALTCQLTLTCLLPDRRQLPLGGAVA